MNYAEFHIPSTGSRIMSYPKRDKKTFYSIKLLFTFLSNSPLLFI